MPDNSPQLGGQSQSDNAPMISGRGTKIIVSARGAYEARNLPALFDAMSPDQQVLFRQAAVRAMLAHIRPELEQAAESQPTIYDMLRSLDVWLASAAPIAEGVYTNPTDTRFGDVSSIEGRLRGLEVAAIFTHHNAIGYATDALLYVPDDDVPQQPHYLIMQSELEDWIFESGWAILHGRSAPPLILNAARIDALIGDVDYWYKKRNLEILVQLMSEDQQDRFKQAVRHQAQWFVATVPAHYWSSEDQQIIAQTQGWLENPSNFSSADLRSMGAILMRRGWGRLADELLYALLRVFDEDDDQYQFEIAYADHALRLVLNVKRIQGAVYPEDFKASELAYAWQLDAAYAILTEHPIPPLGDPQ